MKIYIASNDFWEHKDLCVRSFIEDYCEYFLTKEKAINYIVEEILHEMNCDSFYKLYITKNGTVEATAEYIKCSLKEYDCFNNWNISEIEVC